MVGNAWIMARKHPAMYQSLTILIILGVVYLRLDPEGNVLESLRIRLNLLKHQETDL